MIIIATNPKPINKECRSILTNLENERLKWEPCGDEREVYLCWFSITYTA